MLGYDSLGECLGRNIAESFYLEPEERQVYLDAVHRYGEVRDYEVVLKKKDGTPLFAAVSSHLYKDQSGNVTGIEGIIRDISERHAVAERIRAHITQMGFFSRKLQEFIELPPGADLYQAIGAGLRELLPSALVNVNSYRAQESALTVRSVLGEKERDCVFRYFGNDIIGRSIRVDERVSENLRTGKVFPLRFSLYDLVFHQLPAEACESFEKTLDIGDFYTIGLVRQNSLFGVMTVALKKGEVLTNVPLIELYAKAASIDSSAGVCRRSAGGERSGRNQKYGVPQPHCDGFR